MIQYSFLQFINSFRVFQFSLKTHCQYHFHLSVRGWSIRTIAVRSSFTFNSHCQLKWSVQRHSIFSHWEDTFYKEKFQHCLSNIHGCLMGKLDLEHQTCVITQPIDRHQYYYQLVVVVYRLQMYQSLDSLDDDIVRLAGIHHLSIPMNYCSVEIGHYGLKLGLGFKFFFESSMTEDSIFFGKTYRWPNIYHIRRELVHMNFQRPK